MNEIRINSFYAQTMKMEETNIPRITMINGRRMGFGCDRFKKLTTAKLFLGK